MQTEHTPWLKEKSAERDATIFATSSGDASGYDFLTSTSSHGVKADSARNEAEVKGSTAA